MYFFVWYIFCFQRLVYRADVVNLWTIRYICKVVAEYCGFFHGSRLRRVRCVLTPNAGECSLDFFLEAGD